MTSLGEFAYAKLLECDLLKANQIEGNINLTDISTNTLSFNDKWKFSLDTTHNLLLTNVMQDIVSLSGDAQTGYISFLGGGGGGGGVTDLSDLNDVTPPNPSDTSTFGSIMYYDQPTNRYSFTNALAYLVASWAIRIPLIFGDIDLQILQGANDLSKNIHIGGAKRISAPVDGRSICIGEESGQTSQQNNCLALGYRAGKNNQGTGIITFGDSIAIGTSSGENNQEDAAISIGSFSGQNNQKASCIAIGNNAGNLNQNVNSLAIGYNAGKTNQGVNSIAIGFNSGLSDCAGYSTFIGTSAGNTGSNSYAVGIGYLTSSVNAGTNSIGIGREALFSGSGDSAISIGKFAGRSNFPNNSIAIGTEAGENNGGQNCIYIGEGAALNGGNHNNVIVLNASSTQNNPAGSDRCYIKPLRAIEGTSIVQYDNTSGEVTHNNTISGVNVTGAITLNGNSGVSGEVITSQGASAPIWSAPTTPTASLNSASFALTFNKSFTNPNTEELIDGSFTTLVTSGDITNNNNGTFTINTTGTYLINCSLIFQRTLISAPFLLASVYLYLKNDPLGNPTNRTTLVESITNTSSDQYLQQEIDYSYVNTFNSTDIIRLEGKSDDNFIAVGIRNTTIARTHINFIRLS
jgi:hypothetical protein